MKFKLGLLDRLNPIPPFTIDVAKDPLTKKTIFSMSAYEMTVLLRDEKDVKEVKQLLESSKSKIKSEKSWGKRNLSYPINKETAAYYITMELEIAPTQVTELKKKLNFNEKMIRYLLLNKEE